MLRERGRKGARRREVVDQAAAVVILQHAIDTERSTGRPPGQEVGDLREPARISARRSSRAGVAGASSPGAACQSSSRALVIALIGVLAYVKGVDLLKDWLDDHQPAVTTQATAPAASPSRSRRARRPPISRDTLFDAGVVKSVDAFIEAANGQPAVDVDPGRLLRNAQEDVGRERARADCSTPTTSMVTNTLTIPEGKRADEIVELIADVGRLVRRRQVQKAYDDTKALGLPSYAEGDPEGYLFPATYNIAPNATPARCSRRWSTSSRSRADARSSSRRVPPTSA